MMALVIYFVFKRQIARQNPVIMRNREKGSATFVRNTIVKQNHSDNKTIPPKFSLGVFCPTGPISIPTFGDSIFHIGRKIG